MTGRDAIRPTLVETTEAADARSGPGRGPAGRAHVGRSGSPKGPRPSFDSLYRRHYPRVLGLCRRLLQNAPQAEDAAQEVFMRAYRAFGDYDEAQPFAPWVLKIAGNHCVDIARRRAKEVRLFGGEATELARIESDQPGVVAGLISAERESEVRAAIDRLPDRYRIPLVLAYYNESSYDDIAATLGITRNHVGVLILRGKEALRRELGAAAAEGERK